MMADLPKDQDRRISIAFRSFRIGSVLDPYDGVAVSRDELQPGDILCFGYSAWGITHVGIYIGDGQMIHASTYTTGVIVSDVDTGYYNNTFIGAKRVV